MQFPLFSFMALGLVGVDNANAGTDTSVEPTPLLRRPTEAPTYTPTVAPTEAPTYPPTVAPTEVPTYPPTVVESTPFPTMEESTPAPTEESTPFSTVSTGSGKVYCNSGYEEDQGSLCPKKPDSAGTCFDRRGVCDVATYGLDSSSISQSGENVIEGTMQLALVMDSTDINCQNTMDLEKTILNYLADNVGGEGSTFSPVCASIVNFSRDVQIVSGGDGGSTTVETTSFEVELKFVEQSHGWRSVHFLRDDHGRKLQGCNRSQLFSCCSQREINSNPSDYCRRLGCNFRQCGSGRGRGPRRRLQETHKTGNKRRTSKSSKSKSSKSKSSKSKSGKAKDCPWYGALEGRDFTKSLQKLTDFDPEKTRAILNVDSSCNVSVCSNNRYSIEEFGKPILTCEEYKKYECDVVEDGGYSDGLTKKPLCKY